MLESDPFQFVQGDEAHLLSANTTRFANYKMTYDEISEGLMYVYRVDSSHARLNKRNERGSWMVGCPNKADLALTATCCPRIAQRAYFYAPNDPISTKLMALTTASTSTAAGESSTSWFWQLFQRNSATTGQKRHQKKKKMHFVIKKKVYWLADVPQCNIRVAVLTLDKTLLQARHEAAMTRVLEKMHEMGFTDDKRNRRALEKHNGDINAAIQDLI